MVDGMARKNFEDEKISLLREESESQLETDEKIQKYLKS